MTAIQKAREALDEALRQLDINVSIARRDHPEGPTVNGERMKVGVLPHSQEVLASHVKDRIREALAALDAETEVRDGGTIAEQILLLVRRFIAAEDKHAALRNAGRENETSRDEADLIHAELVGYSISEVDSALALVRRRIRSALVPPEARS